MHQVEWKLKQANRLQKEWASEEGREKGNQEAKQSAARTVIHLSAAAHAARCHSLSLPLQLHVRERMRECVFPFSAALQPTLST